MLIKKFFLGFIRIHILYHASEEPVYGQEMITELKRHGYNISPGTMYPVLHDLENAKYLKSASRNVNGKLRRYYTATRKGKQVLAEARNRIKDLVGEVMA
ncbi:MAG: helix-turn-helix transcriptional regulator [Thermoplasmata archaeon]|nr:MAG: helix-turn-helix transcriptional regulator [Thermoplasmata archaeon]